MFGSNAPCIRDDRDSTHNTLSRRIANPALRMS
jgi:hypothetical protein